MKLNQEILKGLSEAVGDKLPAVSEFNKFVHPAIVSTNADTTKNIIFFITIPLLTIDKQLK